MTPVILAQCGCGSDEVGTGGDYNPNSRLHFAVAQCRVCGAVGPMIHDRVRENAHRQAAHEWNEKRASECVRFGGA